MKISSTTMPAKRCQSLVINLLLIVLSFSSFTSGNVKIQARQTEEKPGPNSIHYAQTVWRNHALTSSIGQRVAGELSKQNRSKYSLFHCGMAPAKVGLPPALIRQRLVNTDQSVWYFSFRSSGPRGRAPPAFA